MGDSESADAGPVKRPDSAPCEETLQWLSATAIQLVTFSPEGDLYQFICENVKQLVGDAIVGVSSIDVEANVLQIRRVAGLGGTRLRRAEELLQKKVIGSVFEAVDEEAKRQLNTGLLNQVEGGLYRMFFGRVPRPVCYALETLLGIKSIHSIGLRRNSRLLGNVTILTLGAARLNKPVIEAFVNQASAALDRQRAEADARQANENLSVIARNVTDMVWMADLRGLEEISADVLAAKGFDAEGLLDRWRFTFVSPSSRRVLGYAPEDLKRLPLRDLLTERSYPGVGKTLLEQLRAALADPAHSLASGPLEIEHVCGDRQTRWCEITARFLRNDQSNIVGVLGVTRDIDDRRQETEALRQERNRLNRLLEMHERDRNLVAYEIHDGLVQRIVAARMFLDSHLQRSDGDGAVAPSDEHARKAFELLSAAIADARRLMRGLRPAALDDFGVLAALENLVTDYQTDAGPAIQLTHDVRFDRLAPSLETAVFRVVQEALTNAVRHAKSDCIQVRLVQEGGQLRIEVADRGVGFDPADVSSMSFGLEGIRQRARLSDGHVRIDSRPSRGTTITVVLPLAPNPLR